MALLNDPRRRERMLQAMSRDNTPDVKPLGGDQGMAVLKEMNDLEWDHEEFVKSFAPRGDVLE